MKSTNNFIFITLEKEFEDRIAGPAGKLQLDLMSFKDNIVDEYDQVIYNVNEKRINYGTVIAIPDKLSKEERIYQEDPGKPEPSRYVSHDNVKQAPDFLKYDPGAYVAKWKTAADIVPEVEVGDRVYFHFNTISPENRVALPDGRTIYKLAYQNALCVVKQKGYFIDLDFLDEKYFPGETPRQVLDRFYNNKEKFIEETKELIDKWRENNNDKIVLNPIQEINVPKIIPIGSNVFIEPEYEDGVVDLGTDGTKGKISPGGLITEIGVRPKALRGIVRHVGEPLRGHVREVKPGDKIVYSKNSDWTVKVEGKDYYCMKQWDIEGIITE